MCVLLFFFFFIRSILSLTPVSSRTNPDEFPHLASSWIKDVRISSGSQVLSWLYSVFCVCSHFDSSVCLVVLSSEPQQRRKKNQKKKKPGHGDDTAAGGAKPEFSTGTTELGAFREAEGGEERCGASPTCLGTWKGLVDHSLWGDWMQRRRPPAGHNKDGLDCEKRASGRERALDSELRSRRGSSLSTHWPPLV